MGNVTPDQRADELMARQHGAINRRQALGCGLSNQQVNRRVASGRWLRRERSVYVGAAVAPSGQQRAAVAVLRGPVGTVASHLTAAALWGLCGFPARPHVTVSPTGARGFATIDAHRSPLAAPDVAAAGGIPCTAPARTLVDAASRAGYRRICDLVDRAVFLELTTPDEIRSAMARASARPGRAGLGRLARALQIWTPGPKPGSPPEMRLLRLLTEWGLPVPQRQLPIADQSGKVVAYADLGCPKLKLLYEYDGEEFHGPRQAPLDAARQRKVEALGWTVVRVRKADLRAGGRLLRARLAKLPALGDLLAA